MRLATRLRKRGFTPLVELLETLQASPSSPRVVLAQDILDSLRVKDLKTLARLLAWCRARGVNVVEVPEGTVLAPSDLFGAR